MKNLKNALLGNAIFSMVSGILLILFPAFWAKMFELVIKTPFWVIGVGLVIFSATVFYEAFKQRRWAVIWIIIQDMLWVLASIFLLILRPFGISLMGNWIITCVALMVFIFAILQYLTLPKQ